ncbi:hypothetical protein PTSG_01999 [Salpingoeca rosetta]|uniref:Kazal-like domain-containing protein n=1 Tax=Salpingoeca rosetta (strain ATCC 50818 / BSB-021) TaxID=946362 RepID=F2TZK7_SALR5|nr:uncharacterized protein PTSG_01999 [Salpingoeca rosetta]EGD79031.1 hypothetical protein PTSG_01999 [Salpingoeca rosetta]|eukprot:XP_004997987.1 hypothetical protein PTSG_01999 [Salpingoeca rosetta]
MPATMQAATVIVAAVVLLTSIPCNAMRVAAQAPLEGASSSSTWSSSSSTSSLPYTSSSEASSSTSSLAFTSTVPDTTSLLDTTTWQDTTSTTTTIAATTTTTTTAAEPRTAVAAHDVSRWPTPTGEECFCTPSGGPVCGVNGQPFENACIPSCARIPFFAVPCDQARLAQLTSSTTTTMTELASTTAKDTGMFSTGLAMVLSWFSVTSSSSVVLQFTTDVDVSTIDVNRIYFYSSEDPSTMLQLEAETQAMLPTDEGHWVQLAVSASSWADLVELAATHVLLLAGAVHAVDGAPCPQMVAGRISAPSFAEGNEPVADTTAAPTSNTAGIGQTSTTVLVGVVLAVCLVLVAISALMYAKQKRMSDYKPHLLDLSETASSFVPSPVPRRKKDAESGLEWDNLLRFNNGLPAHHPSWYSEGLSTGSSVYVDDDLLAPQAAGAQYEEEHAHEVDAASYRSSVTASVLFS